VGRSRDLNTAEYVCFITGWGTVSQRDMSAWTLRLHRPSTVGALLTRLNEELISRRRGRHATLRPSAQTSGDESSSLPAQTLLPPPHNARIRKSPQTVVLN